MTFDEFFAEHYDRVVRTLALAVGDRVRAEDAAQEAFARAFRKWPDVSRMDRPAGWVVVVAMNHLRRRFTRIDQRETTHDSDLVSAECDHTDRFVLGLALQDALDRLPPRQRETVVLRFLCDLSTEDVARALGCRPGTVKSALHQALITLRIGFSEQNDAPTETTRPAALAGRGDRP